MERKENRTKQYKTTLGDWIPGYGIYKQTKLTRKGVPCILSDKSSEYNLMYTLVQCAPFSYMIARGIEALIQ